MEDFSWDCRGCELNGSSNLIKLSRDAVTRICRCNFCQALPSSQLSCSNNTSLTIKGDVDLACDSDLDVLIDDSSYLQGQDWALLQTVVNDLIRQASEFGGMNVQASFLNQTQHGVLKADVHWVENNFPTIIPNGPRPIGSGLESVFGFGGYRSNTSRNALFITASDPDEDYDQIEQQVTSFLRKNARPDGPPRRVGILQLGSNLQATIFWRGLDKAIRSTLGPLGAEDIWTFRRLKNRDEYSDMVGKMLSSLLKIDPIRKPVNVAATALEHHSPRAARLRRPQSPPALVSPTLETNQQENEVDRSPPLPQRSPRHLPISQPQTPWVDELRISSAQPENSSHVTGYSGSFIPLEVTEPLPVSTQSLMSHLLRYRFCTIINCIYYSILFASFVLGLSWTVIKSDVQGGFTLAAYIAMVASGIILPIQNRHSRGCRCFERQIAYVVHI